MSNLTKEITEIPTTQFEKLLKEQTLEYVTKHVQTFRTKKYTHSQIQ